MKKIFSILFIVTLLKVNAQKLDTHISGIIIDKDYPEPIVNHEKARNAALVAFQKIKK